MLTVLTFVASMGMLFACQVPVFRYALERWVADRYELVIVPRQGGLTEDESGVLKYLKETFDGSGIPNLVVRVDEESENATNAAVASLYYPGRRHSFEPTPIWTGKVTMESVRQLIDSPARRELATRILKGESSIWLLVESGDKVKDDEAAITLKERLRQAQDALELPEGVIGREEAMSPEAGPVDRENILQSDVPLMIDFSVLRVSRSDLEESIFLTMMLNLEDDLGELATEPMVFPIFGRGRVLEPLVGKGITEGNILEYAGYLCGACSCEVKDQNPGMDLLMAVNWDAAIAGSEVIIDKVLPPLEGVAGLIAVGETAIDAPKGSAPKGSGPQVEPDSSQENHSEMTEPDEVKPFMSLRLVLAAIIALIAASSVAVLRKKKS